jgi:hypothetical protein
VGKARATRASTHRTHRAQEGHGAATPIPGGAEGHIWPPGGAILGVSYVIMCLCDSRLPSVAPGGAPSRGSPNQITAGDRDQQKVYR